MVERFPVVDVASPDRLPAGRELAYHQERGDLVAQVLPGPVGQLPCMGHRPGLRVRCQRGDRRGGLGNAPGQPGRDRPETSQRAGKLIEASEGAKTERY